MAYEALLVPEGGWDRDKERELWKLVYAASWRLPSKGISFHLGCSKTLWPPAPLWSAYKWSRLKAQL